MAWDSEWEKWSFGAMVLVLAEEKEPSTQESLQMEFREHREEQSLQRKNPLCADDEGSTGDLSMRAHMVSSLPEDDGEASSRESKHIHLYH